MRLSAAATLSAVLLLSACGEPEAPSSPTTGTSEDVEDTTGDPAVPAAETSSSTGPDTETTSAEALPSIEAPSPSTVLVTETATAAPAEPTEPGEPTEPTEEEPAEEEPADPTEEEPGEEEPTESSEPTEPVEEQPGSGGECSSGAYTPAELRGEGVPGPAVQTADLLLTAAIECDSTTLVSLAEEDGTVLGFGEGEPADLLAVPDPENQYLSIAALLTATTPVVVDGRAVWPAALQEGADDAAWQEIIDAGLHSEEDVATMRASGQYLGWRVGIDVEDGTWNFFVAGD